LRCLAANFNGITEFSQLYVGWVSDEVFDEFGLPVQVSFYDGQRALGFGLENALCTEKWIRRRPGDGLGV
jgi:hypothetical protein